MSSQDCCLETFWQKNTGKYKVGRVVMNGQKFLLPKCCTIYNELSVSTVHYYAAARGPISRRRSSGSSTLATARMWSSMGDIIEGDDDIDDRRKVLTSCVYVHTNQSPTIAVTHWPWPIACKNS